jgi:uncharacterized OB-fold protein
VTEQVITLGHFFAEARAGRLTAIRCRRCQELAIPPKEYCPACQARDWEPVPLRGTGTIASYTVIRVPPRGQPAGSPYAVAVVRLDEGVSLLGRVVGVPVDAVTTGLPVRFQPLLDEHQTAVGFAPA